MSRQRCAFTLIELLIVVAIISILSSMLFPILGVIRTNALKQRTTFILTKVDTALRLFKGDWGVYPYHAAYPDFAAGQTFTTVPNHLNYRIGTDITTAAGANVRQDMIAVSMLYNYSAPTTVTYTTGNFPTCIQYADTGIMLNRLAEEQQSIALLAGNVNMRGQIISNGTGGSAYNKSGTLVSSLVASNPAPYTTISSTGNTPEPGWAANYLAGEIDAKFIDSTGYNILDSYGNPLIYICQAIPGMKVFSGFNCPDPTNPGAYHPEVMSQLTAAQHDARYWGLGALGFDPTTGPGPGLLATRELLLYAGRIRLSVTDASDGQATPQDVSYFPTPSNLLHSDIRYYAAPGFETEFELWSSGPDGTFNYFRDAATNSDNISIIPYNRVVTND